MIQTSYSTLLIQYTLLFEGKISVKYAVYDVYVRNRPVCPLVSGRYARIELYVPDIRRKNYAVRVILTV
jgi:hypothetical protein